jgi:uncharacterized Zn finger protein (UPF0148 family)
MTVIVQKRCQECGAPIIGKAIRCPTCYDTIREAKKLARAKRRYAERKEAATAASSQGGNPNRFER